MWYSRVVEKKEAAVKRCKERLLKLEVQATDREENKQIALGTSKLNYLDPRISVAWWVHEATTHLDDTSMYIFLYLTIHIQFLQDHKLTVFIWGYLLLLFISNI